MSARDRGRRYPPRFIDRTDVGRAVAGVAPAVDHVLDVGEDHARRGGVRAGRYLGVDDADHVGDGVDAAPDAVEDLALTRLAVDDVGLNTEIRKFLKKVGVTSQREIEKAVKGALEAEKLSGSETLNARMRLQIDEIDLDLMIEGDIGLA